MEVKRRTAQSLISKLASVSGPTRTAALCELRLLTKHDPDIRPVIADEGAIPYLAETLYSDAPLDQDNAAATLLNVSIACPEALMSTRGLLDALSHTLSHHTRHHPSAVQSAAATVYSLVIDENYRPVVGSKRDIVYALIDIVRTPDSPAKSMKDALKALFGLALYPLNRTTMVELGAAAALFGLVVNDGRVGVVEDATAVIAQMAGCEESAEAFRRVSGIRVLVDLLDPGTGWSARIRENAVSGLLNLAGFGQGVVVEIRELGSEFVFHGLGEVVKNGSIKGRKRAQTLIDILGRVSLGGLELSPMNSINSGMDSNSDLLMDSHSY